MKNSFIFISFLVFVFIGSVGFCQSHGTLATVDELAALYDRTPKDKRKASVDEAVNLAVGASRDAMARATPPFSPLIKNKFRDLIASPEVEKASVQALGGILSVWEKVSWMLQDVDNSVVGDYRLDRVFAGEDRHVPKAPTSLEDRTMRPQSDDPLVEKTDPLVEIQDQISGEEARGRLSDSEKEGIKRMPPGAQITTYPADTLETDRERKEKEQLALKTEKATRLEAAEKRRQAIRDLLARMKQIPKDTLNPADLVPLRDGLVKNLEALRDAIDPWVPKRSIWNLYLIKPKVNRATQYFEWSEWTIDQLQNWSPSPVPQIQDAAASAKVEASIRSYNDILGSAFTSIP